MSDSIFRDRRSVIATFAVFAMAMLVIAMLSTRSDATEPPASSETFSVLQPASASPLTVLPADVQGWLSTPVELGGPGRAPEEVGIASTLTGAEVMVISAGESICFRNLNDGMSNCASATLAASGQVYSASPDLAASPNGCAGWRIVGLVPNGVTSLTVDSASEDVPATLPVTSNVYAATLPPADTTLSSGAISIEVPLEKFAEGNSAC